MEIVSLQFVDADLKERLLPYLKNTIFHLTTLEAYKQILCDGEIRNNKNRTLSLNTGSEHSFGRKRGYVCLFNFKNKSDEIIDDTLIRCYYFLDPSWFREYYEDRTESNLAYFIFDDKFHHLIIDNDAAKTAFDQHVQHTECWIKDKVLLEYIDRVLLVKIIKSLPEDPFLLAHHRLNLERQNIKNG